MAKQNAKKMKSENIGEKKPSIIKLLINNIKTHPMLYIFVLPMLAYFLIFSYGPMYGIQLAFKDFSPRKGIWGSEWVALDNFMRFFKGSNAWKLIWNTISLNLYSLIVSFPAPIILALLLNEVKSTFFKKSVQMITYAPHFISVVIVVGMLDIFLGQTSGFFNVMLKNLGLNPIPFLESNEWFQTTYVFSGIWQGVGWGSIIYMAALAGVPQDCHEAAIVDGASKLHRIWHINIPAILPTATILFILNIGKMMNVGFEKVFLMQNPLNQTASDVISTYVYRIGLVQADYGFGTAVGLFNSIVNCLLLIFFNKLTKKMGQTSLW